MPDFYFAGGCDKTDVTHTSDRYVRYTFYRYIKLTEIKTEEKYNENEATTLN